MAAGRYVLRGAVEVVLGGEHVLQLAVVEEDPTAVLALLDVHTLPVDRAHPTTAFGTSHASQDRGVVRHRVGLSAGFLPPAAQRGSSVRRRISSRVRSARVAASWCCGGACESWSSAF